MNLIDCRRTGLVGAVLLAVAGSSSAGPAVMVSHHGPAGPAVDPTLGPMPEGDTVDYVDLSAYLGTWYEIASIPQSFQRGCAGTTATYEAVDQNTVRVINRCRVDGAERVAEGIATVVDLVSNARLAVAFGRQEAGPYWIVDLGVRFSVDEPYPWAVVSNPDRSALWILNREPTMPADRFAAIVDRLQQRGFVPERLTMTEQP
jgi:apolipoprotein D and lipocalin family protein